MMQFLEQHLSKDDNVIFDSLVIVIFGGGYDYKPGHVYDKDGIEINTEVLFEMIRQSPAFKNKPKIVIISTYDLTEGTHVFDELAAVQIPKINTDDLFVVTAKPKTKNGQWIIGDEMNGSYFIQAFVHVFKKMAHKKSFKEMMIEVGDCLQNAMVADQRKEAVAEIFILEQCEEKELFFFPGLSGVPAIHMKVPGWPDFSNAGMTVRKKDVKMSELGFFMNRQKEKHVQCIPYLDNQSEKDMVTEKRYLECIRNVDFDKSNMSQLFKYMGYDLKGGNHIKNSTKEEIKDFLKTKLTEIDNDSSSQYDSLVILFLSGKILCDAAKIYDKNGDILRRREILDIIEECKHFKGKPKVIFVQSFSFIEETEPMDCMDPLDSISNDIITNGEPNTDDLFVVSSYPRIEQGPWIIGENMNGSYIIQALVHVFKNSAYKKSFMELLKEANICLGQAMIPKLTDDGKNSGTVEKRPVAQIVLLEYSEDKELYFFPGLDIKAPVYKVVEPVDLHAMSGRPVCVPTD